MNLRLHATAVIARRRLFETLLSPGYYVAQTCGLVLAWLLVAGFVRAVDSSGFDFTLDPAWDLIGRGLAGAFGTAFTAKLFAEGPFLFILYAAFLPVLLYLAVSSVFRIGLEKKVGALELLTYGPADAAAWLLAALLKDLLLTLAALALLLLFLLAAAGLNNLLLGPAFFANLSILFFLAAAVYGYGILAAALTDNSASAVALFLGLILLFGGVTVGSFAVVGGYARTLASVSAWVIKWVSPLFYWELALRSAELRNWGKYLAGALLLALLAAALLAAGHLLMKLRGVRP